MNHSVAIDYLKRKWWIFTLAAIFHFCFTFTGWESGEKKGGVMMLMSIGGGSAFLLLFELMRGNGAIPRTLLSLPMRARDLARTWRFLGLEFPVLLFLGVLLLSALVPVVFEPGAGFPFQQFMVAAFVQTALLGTIFFALTGIPITHFPSSPMDWAKQIFFGFLFGLSIPGSMFLVEWLPANWNDVSLAHLLVGLALAAATLAGWLRADVLVRNRIARSKRGGSSIKQGEIDSSSKGRVLWTKSGGTLFFLLHFGRNVGIMGLIILTSNWVLMSIFVRMQGTENAADKYLNQPQTETFVPIVVLILCMQMITQIRALRSLPISRAGLTNLMILATAGFGLMFWAVATAVHAAWSQFPPQWVKLPSTVSSLVILLFCVPVFLRFGYRLISFIFLPVLMIGVQMEKFATLSKVPEGMMLIIYGCTIVFGGAAVWALTYFMLGTKYPWREGVLKGPFQQRRI